MAQNKLSTNMSNMTEFVKNKSSEEHSNDTQGAKYYKGLTDG